MTEKMNGASLDISAENRARLKQLFPTVFTETVNDKGEMVESLDFEKLKAELGTFSDLFESRRERYGMDWPGKKESLRLIQTQSHATLKPCRGESVNFDTTENLFIEGDNLEVLKLLQKSYYCKVKMIYIDPPYNTGKEFIYPDNYSESLETYLEYAGLIDGEGKKFSTNTANEGRFHTKWLNMMYPRLYLARNLLRDDGVIFISIDDNEVSNLRKVCDEIFGEENIIESFVWRSRLGKGSTSTETATIHEYIICYSKNIENIEFLSDVRTKESDSKERLRQWGQGDKREDRPSMYFPIYHKEYGEVYPIKTDGTDGRWRASKDKVDVMVKSNLLIFEKQNDGRIEVYRKILSGSTTETAQDSILDKEVVKTTAHGSKETSIIFEGKIFDYPKPTALLKHFLKMVNNDGAIILDFFAGSCTAAHAVLDLNKQDNGNRRFICVQLPEPCAPDSEAFKAGYKTIADIGKERIRRVINKLSADDRNNPQITQKNADKEQKNLFDFNLRTSALSADNIPPRSAENISRDPGFRVLKLDQSNFRQWQQLASTATPEQIAEQLDLHIDHINHKASQEDLLFEILLKAGFTPTEKIEVLELQDRKLNLPDNSNNPQITQKDADKEQENISEFNLRKSASSADGLTNKSADKKVFSIAEGALLICLEESVTKELIDAVIEANPQQFICLDSAFHGNDQLKANAVQTFNARNMQKEKHNQIVFRTV